MFAAGLPFFLIASSAQVATFVTALIVKYSSEGKDGKAGVSTVNERTAHKLKSHFDAAKVEIDNAKQSRLANEAISHYQIARRILSEAISTPEPSDITSSEMKRVIFYRLEILKRHVHVEDRLQTLTQRAGGSSKNKVSNDELAEMINSLIEIVDPSKKVKWEDIAGLENAKRALREMVILPTKRRDLFNGLTKPAKGLLLFGPPGTGKTMLAKAVAWESDATFFNVSASSLTSKWLGESEKLVRTLFQVAVSRQPSVIFIDEIDSIMSTRRESEHEASRRLKSEFLLQFDGVGSNPDDLVTVIGATNKPQELDDALLRRLVKRIYIPLPDANARRVHLKHQLIKNPAHSLPDGDVERIVAETDGYSGSDLQALCEEAAKMRFREIEDILTVQADQVRNIMYGDFKEAVTVVRPSLQRSKWNELEKWNREFGSN